MDQPTSRANYARFLALNRALAAEFRIRGTVRFGYAAAVRVQLLARRERGAPWGRWAGPPLCNVLGD